MHRYQHHTNQTCNRRRLLGGSITCLLIGAFLYSPMAIAQDDTTGEIATVEVRFWAYSRNPEFFAYSTTNHLGEVLFIVGQAGNPEPVYTEAATDDRSARDILMSDEVRGTYTWAADGVRGTTSPSGASELVTTVAGSNVAISVRQAGRNLPIGTIPLIGAPANTTAEVKEVRWSPDDTVVVVILHQILTGEWPMEVDVAYGFSVPAAPEPEAPAPAPAPAE